MTIPIGLLGSGQRCTFFKKKPYQLDKRPMSGEVMYERVKRVVVRTTHKESVGGKTAAGDGVGKRKVGTAGYGG